MQSTDLSIEVFERTLASRSMTCVAILFGNLNGVKDAGDVYSILEHAAKERLSYFTFKLATPDGVVRMPDHACWFSYTQRADACVRASDFDSFAKLNLFELGAQIRRLRERVKYDSSMLPRPGQEFMIDSFLEHLHLIGYLGPWLSALGFDLMGKAGFLEALRIFSVFCQRGLHYRGQPRETHKRHLHDLYTAMVADLYTGFRPFRERKLLSYNQLISFDNLFPQDGKFYATHRELMLEVAELDRLSDRLSDIGSPHRMSTAMVPGLPGRAALKRPLRYQASASSAALPRLLPPAPRLALTMRPPSPTVGSFAFAVKDYPDSISIMSNRYAKAPILERLNLTEDEICLAAYLSDKGAAACPHSRSPGHERADSPAHIFSDAVLALRPLFEQHPFKITRTTTQLSRQQPARPASRSAGPLRLQYNPPSGEQPSAPPAVQQGQPPRAPSRVQPAPPPAPVAPRPSSSQRPPSQSASGASSSAPPR